MVSDEARVDLEALVERLAITDDAEARALILAGAYRPDCVGELAERLKVEAYHARLHDPTLSLRWCDDIKALGRSAGDPTIVALGHMAAGLALLSQDRLHDSLAVFDEASTLFRAHGDEVGWARTQIGRTAPCAMLGRFDEALQRAHEARAILEAAGDTLRLAAIDDNLAMLLEHMNRPAEALVYNEQALVAYRIAGAHEDALHTLHNHALLLWRLGRAREAIASYTEAREGYRALDARVDAAREDLHIGSAYLALGRYAEAVQLLQAARRDLLLMESQYLAAWASLSLAECLVRLGRFHDAIESAAQAHEEFTRCATPVESVQSLTWKALAHAGLHEHDAALQDLDRASGLLSPTETLASYRATLDVSRAQLLLDADRAAEAGVLLAGAIPALSQAGVAVEAAMAQVLMGDVLVEDGRADEACGLAGEALAVAEREGLEWLMARALHLRGRAEVRRHDNAAAHDALAAAVLHLDRAHRYVTWDDRVTFAGATVRVYADAMDLAIRQGQPCVALQYAERYKARALADHLRAGIDVRLRARDEQSAALVAELEALRERYAWLGADRSTIPGEATPTPIVRWAAAPAERGEAAEIERRIAAIWRELQARNQAYRGDAAALDLAPLLDDEGTGDESAARDWVGALHSALGDDDRTALLEYSALGDDLVLFVVRSGDVQALCLPSAGAVARRLVSLLRLQVEAGAAAVGRGSQAVQALAASMRGLLRRLHDALLAPAAPLLDGVSRLVVVAHGATHHVPFHALHDGRQYLIERMEVSYAPCATLVEHFVQRHRLLSATRGVDEAGVLALACSHGGMLPHVDAEGQAVVGALGGRLLREDDATRNAVRALAGRCAVLHVAAHGRFRPDEPLFSALYLHDGPLSTLDVFDLDLGCSLATLSACETALGTAGAGDELMGLSRAFLYAGAPSLILSLWKVEDSSTTALMGAFYTALRGGERKGEALRHAQLALLHHEIDGCAGYDAPFYWAPFQLIGHTGSL